MPGKHNAGGCGCCCNECDTMQDEYLWNVCADAYVDDPDLNSTRNTVNANTLQAMVDAFSSSTSDRGYLNYGSMAAYGPYDRGGTDYEGYQLSADLMGPGTTPVPVSFWGWITDACNPDGSTQFASQVFFDELLIVLGCEWPVGDACHPRWYWGIVFKSTATAADYTWLCFSEDLGAGPEEAVFVDGTTFPFKPPVLPAAPATECEEPPTPWPAYMVDFVWITAVSNPSVVDDYCVRNPFPDVEMNWTYNTIGATLPECL